MATHMTHTVGRADLAGAFAEFVLDESVFIGDLVFPVIGHNKRKANFPAITRESLTSMEDSIRRAEDGTYPDMHLKTEDLAYACEAYGVNIGVDDDQGAELSGDYGVDIDQVAGRTAFFQVRRQHDKRVADLAFDAVTNFTAGNGNYTDVSGSQPWTTASSTILPAILTAQEAVQGLTGMIPMDMAINYTNFNRLLQNTTIRGFISTQKDQTVTAVAALLAPLLGLERIHVAMDGYNATAGMGTFVAAKSWSNLYAQVFVNSTAGDLTQPRLGATHLWTPRSPLLVNMEEWRKDASDQTMMRARHMVDETIIDKFFGHLLKIAAS